MRFFEKFFSYMSSRTAGEELTPAPHRRSFVPRKGAVDLFGGDTVGTMGAMQVSTVFACVRILSESVASLPLEVMHREGEVYEPRPASPLGYLLLTAPNEHTSAFDFWACAVQEMLLEGNAYIIPEYDPELRAVARLTLCRRGTVMHDAMANAYTVNDAEQGVCGTFAEAEVIHLKNVTLDGKHGLSTLRFARLTSRIAVEGDQETLSRFENGGNIRGIVSNDNGVRGFGEYQDAELNRAARDLDADFDRQRIVSLPGGVDFKQLSLSSTDMQFLETRKFTVREICRFFRVPPTYVYDDTATNYKSAENASVAFLSQSLGPLLRKIENELERKLIPRELSPYRRIRFDRRSLFAADLDSRVNYQTKTIAAGIYSVNDWRREENRPPVEGGDRVFVSTNLRGINDPLPSAPRNNPNANEP